LKRRLFNYVADIPAARFTFFTMVFIMAMAAAGHVAIPRNHSIKPFLLWINMVTQENIQELMQPGRYVIFSMRTPTHPSQLIHAVKRVGCTQGHVLKSTPTLESTMEFYCDGQYLGRSKANSLTGGVLTPFSFNGVVPEGKLFAVGDHADSYDSKYIGFVDITQIRSVAWPVF
jgi:type IV secretory pathway protease TraF